MADAEENGEHQNDDLSPTPVKKEVARVAERLAQQHPALKMGLPSLMAAYGRLVECFINGGTLFLAGNGGSMADALHISGELEKSFTLARPALAFHQQRLVEWFGAAELAQALQRGLRVMPLGNNPALLSAVGNDISLAQVGIAQELYALAQPADLLWLISTSGNAQNLVYAAQVARVLGLPVILLTGPQPGKIAPLADVCLHAPGANTPEIQGWHIQIYHALCEMLEVHFFGGGNGDTD